MHQRHEPPRHSQPHRRPAPVHTSGPAVAQGPEQEFTGVLELISSGSGFLRRLDEDLQPSQGDVFVPPSLIQQKRLASGNVDACYGCICSIPRTISSRYKNS